MIGSIMWYVSVVRSCFSARKFDDRVSRLAKDLKKWYKTVEGETEQLAGELTEERVRESGSSWARLKTKAAKTRHVAPYALFLLIRIYGDADHPVWGEHDCLALALCQMLVELYTILSSESGFLFEATKRRLPELSAMVSSLFVKIWTLAHERGLMLWKLSPELHLLCRMTEYQIVFWGNCKFWLCYQDGDLVGRLIIIAGGLHPATLGSSILCKWVHCVFDQVLISFDED